MTYTPDVWASIIAEGTGGGAGGSAFYVNISYDGTNVTADKTFEEIDAAYTAGQIIVGIYNGNAAILVLNDGAYTAEYHQINVNEEILSLTFIVCEGDNNWYIDGGVVDYRLTPNSDDAY
jgi:hypothetical protein